MANAKMMGVFAALLAVSSAAPPKGVLPTPPMGFNNWARYETDIHESIFTDAADALKSKGLLKVGYNRINLDDAWSTLDRAANGSMVWDPVKFPRGLPWLTSYLKSQGFIPGIYTDAGTKSCGGYPGAQDYEQLDYDTFKGWGFQYLKMDGCNIDYTEAFYHEVYGRWGKIIAADKTPMVFSDSAPAYFSPDFVPDNSTDWYTTMGWVQQIGGLARHSNDVATYPNGNGWKSILTNYRYEARLARYQVPDYINDPDFLIVDHPSLSLDEKKSHFALWCSLSAPLIISANLTALTSDEVAYLSNTDLIAVDQDPLVQQATWASHSKTSDVLTRSLANGDRLVTVLNKNATALTTTVSWARIGLSATDLAKVETLSVKNLWTGVTTKVAVSAGGIAATAIPSHGTAVFRIAVGAVPVTPTGIIFNTYTENCLTDYSTGVVTFAACDGSDAQVWKVGADGHISSLIRPANSIATVAGKVVTTNAAGATETWKYHISGNLISDASGGCLTSDFYGSALVQGCGDHTDDQVFGLPAGTLINY